VFEDFPLDDDCGPWVDLHAADSHSSATRATLEGRREDVGGARFGFKGLQPGSVRGLRNLQDLPRRPLQPLGKVSPLEDDP